MYIMYAFHFYFVSKRGRFRIKKCFVNMFPNIVVKVLNSLLFKKSQTLTSSRKCVSMCICVCVCLCVRALLIKYVVNVFWNYSECLFYENIFYNTMTILNKMFPGISSE